MKKIAIIGHFGFKGNYLDGQTIKTKIVANALEKQLGADQVEKIDTHGGKKVLPKLFFRTISALRHNKNVVMLPAYKGIKFFTPILTFFNKFFKRKLFYVVIGGWLADYLQDKKGLTKRLQKFDGIFVETNTMKTALENMGFKNIFVMPNCKELTILSEEQLIYPENKPYKLCTFSRVSKEKGIEDAVNAVKSVNEQNDRIVYTLDIYGPIDKNQTEWFETLQLDSPDYIKYGGAVPYDKSVEVLKNYFALLFPTKSFTEGIPGTIIDAYAAGIPVISAKWESYDDVMKEKVTGIGYSFNDICELETILNGAAINPISILSLKQNCLNEAESFLPSNVIKVFMEQLE